MVATCGPSHAKNVAKSLKEDWNFDEIVVVEDIEDSFVSGKEKKSSKEDHHENSTNST